MKKTLFITLAVLFSISLFGQLKPYTIGAELSGDFAEAKSKVKSSLKEQGFRVLGAYKPASDANRWLIVINSPDLLVAVKKEGGLSGFAAALRVALTKEGEKIIVSYTTPEYWGNAYFRDEFPNVSGRYSKVSDRLKAAFKSIGGSSEESFGSAKGISASKLRSYHYMMGMPYFDDNVELNSFASYQEAVKTIDANLKAGVKNLKQVYVVEIPEKNIKLYGIGLNGSTGESAFMPKIDIGTPRHTAFLPYEMLVLDNKVYMLHGRFRIALSFPDLKMGTFMKIVSTPGAIEDLLKTATK